MARSNSLPRLLGGRSSSELDVEAANLAYDSETKPLSGVDLHDVDEKKQVEKEHKHHWQWMHLHGEKKAKLTHRDAFGRIVKIDEDDDREYRIRPDDGKLELMEVQSFGDVGRDRVPWKRIGKPKNKTPALIRLSNWTFSSVRKTMLQDYYSPISRMTWVQKYKRALIVALKWLPSCILMIFMLLIPQNLEGEERNKGFYDPIRYRDWGYTKVARNPAENRPSRSHQEHEDDESAKLLQEQSLQPSRPCLDHRRIPSWTSAVSDSDSLMDARYDDMPGRHFRPRYLCFLTPEGGSTTRLVSDWVREQDNVTNPEYVFVSYTRKQFTVATEDELKSWSISEEERRLRTRLGPEHRQLLKEYGARAARAAGVPAFWLDFECLGCSHSSVVTDNDDVWRICDIVRAAHSMIIALGPSFSNPDEPFSAAAKDYWFHEWGTRLWTLPEILLCPPEHRIAIYTAGGGPATPEQLAKRNFASRAWSDAKTVRQLIDHYEGSIHLTPLELVSIALECFETRTTEQRSGGDMAYALMGLLRRRPRVDRSDSSFEAFARLSLANDSDELLERLICMLPVPATHDGALAAQWHHVRDAWGVRLWDIEPLTQVAGIVEKDKVLLDGAYGASITWKSMKPHAYIVKQTLMRKIMKILLRGSPAYLVLSLLWVANLSIAYRDERKYVSHNFVAFLSALSLSFLVPAVLVALCGPWMLRKVYRGKFWSTQASFIGVEGIPADIGECETLLFGYNHGRLQWSAAGSVYSRHHLRHGECVPDAPVTTNPNPNHSRVFTLIDTFNMTATAFTAARPPSAVVVCGREGGMLRGVLCSYDWRSQTFCRETVVRVRTLALDRLLRVDRFRFALECPAGR
ncbi:hypothetical protein IWX90DRAFT_61387 [Phyllosticta citrichinensis]|uniref:3-hydroxyisobutyrate dehydrogenase protein n=1 Tax=Phyllosticta citrichinensis TaxID=1130410 RepID=A0ABR1XH23_9PEZI